MHCYAECHYAECHYAECRYAECHGTAVAQLVERWTINLKFEGSNPGVNLSNQFSKDAKAA